MSKTYFISGQWNSICDSCGFKFKSSKMKKRWDGFMVCPTCFEMRHPQDFLRTRPDRQDLPWSRPRATDSFVPMSYRYNLPMYDDDTVNLSEHISTTIDFVRTLSDTVITSSLLGSDTTKGFNEAPTVSDSLTSITSFTRSVTDTATVSDVLSIVVDSHFTINAAAINTNTIG